MGEAHGFRSPPQVVAPESGMSVVAAFLYHEGKRLRPVTLIDSVCEHIAEDDFVCVILGVIAAVCIGLYIRFKRNHWL
ncbi:MULTISPECIES: hypothetical protein [Sphingomonas]|uniref:Uncharacterized protein n=1 Tax=Sphingomonas molluscorum TaxID=418184 RepID=A0ABU8Q9X8_9SPHN|nr:hypothetical protein [Sphingomonas sp. JUb134]MBM7407933.1 hypothetical protein [Sphingomonas sp. JUb134]